MTTSYRNFALLAGVSVSALCATAPALAAPTVSPGIVHDDSSDPVNDTLTICILNDDCFFGVEDEGEGTVEAFVNSIATGQIRQTGSSLTGDVALNIVNAGDAEIGAHAVATAGSLGYANARAFILTAVLQSGLAATGDVALDLTNSGNLSISALAAADAGSDGGAFASAEVDGGITQFASAAGAGNAAITLDNGGTIEISADASAVGTSAYAYAGILNSLNQVAYARDGGSADISLTNDGEISIVASARAEVTEDGSGLATADAAAYGIFQYAGAENVTTETFATSGGATVLSHYDGGIGVASVALANEGSIAIGASAVATGAQSAFAMASVLGGTQIAIGTEASASLINAGTIEVTANASAVANTVAGALSYNDGLVQYAIAQADVYQTIHATNGDVGYIVAQLPLGPASATLTNEGTIKVSMNLHAEALGGSDNATTFAPGTVAFATGVVNGVQQFAGGSEVSLEIDNSGSIEVGAHVEVNGEDQASSISFVQGIRQGANAVGATVADWYTAGGSHYQGSANFYYAGPASITFDNSGSIDVFATALAVAPEGRADARADARAVSNAVSGTSATISIVNDGDVSVFASADASGTTGLASAVAAGFTQGFSTASDVLTIDIANSGSIEVEATARAIQSNGATALAAAIGLTERGVSYGSASLVLVNEGTIDVHASAVAEGGYFAGGTAWATGAKQSTLTPVASLSFENTGTISAVATMQASADAETGFAGATAYAHGYIGNAFFDANAEIVNGGAIEVSAKATADGAAGWAFATAAGIALVANNTAGTTSAFAGLTGNIENSGDIIVAASAKGIADDTYAFTSTADAVGIVLMSDSNSMTVVNSGTIDVSASVASEDGVVLATGIKVSGGPGIAAADDLFTFTNEGGTLIARQSIDSGETWQRGMAIDVAGAPNSTVINLLGGESGGSIYGNIDLNDGDVINVKDGQTVLDGIINPECVGAADPSTCGQGTLNIVEDGTLLLADPRYSGDPDRYDGPAAGFVETLKLDTSGTLAFGLEPESGGEQDIGSFPQLFAETATLSGTLEAHFAPNGGLFAESYIWNDLIVAGTLSGKFDHCEIGGEYSGSILLNFTCTQDTNSVSAKLERLAFDTVDGLNRNGAAVAGAFEQIYSTDLEGGIATLLGDLFRISDSGDYNSALNHLSGASYANYLNSFGSLGAHYNDLADQATACEGSAVAGSVLECRDGPFHLWGEIDYQHRRADGDGEAGAHRSKRFTGVIGIDAAVGDTAILGVSAGAVKNHFRDRQFGDSIKADGYQLGGYGLLDPGNFYVKGITTYSWFDGDSRRGLDLEPFGGTFSGTLQGDPDVRMWTLGLHSGIRMNLGASVLTPYANVDVVSAKLHGFSETTTSGDDGAELTIRDGQVKNTFATGGIKWAMDMGNLVPEINLGYRHRFGDRRATFTASGIGGEDVDFRIISASEQRGSWLAGVGIGGRVGPVNLRINYEGEFNKDVRSHSGSLKLVVPLGGRTVAAAQPAYSPPVIAPAPMPPAAPVEAPEPATFESFSGERG